MLFSRATQQSFLRLLTTEAVTRAYKLTPMTNAAAWTGYDGLLADRRVGFAPEPPGLQSHCHRLAAGNLASPKLWMEAYLAAFALAGEHELVTTDKALKQFKGARVKVLVGISVMGTLGASPQNQRTSETGLALHRTVLRPCL